MTKDEKDIRGRWKGQGRVSDVYDDVELPYPDAKVAAILCGGGPCYYTTNPRFDTAMVDQFVLSHVAPNVTRKRLPESACLVVGRALLWLIFSPVVDEYVPNEMKERVLLDWAHVASVTTTAGDGTARTNGEEPDGGERESKESNPEDGSGDFMRPWICLYRHTWGSRG